MLSAGLRYTLVALLVCTAGAGIALAQSKEVVPRHSTGGGLTFATVEDGDENFTGGHWWLRLGGASSRYVWPHFGFDVHLVPDFPDGEFFAAMVLGFSSFFAPAARSVGPYVSVSVGLAAYKARNSAFRDPSFELGPYDGGTVLEFAAGIAIRRRLLQAKYFSIASGETFTFYPVSVGVRF